MINEVDSDNNGTIDFPGRICLQNGPSIQFLLTPLHRILDDDGT